MAEEPFEALYEEPTEVLEKMNDPNRTLISDWWQHVSTPSHEATWQSTISEGYGKRDSNSSEEKALECYPYRTITQGTIIFDSIWPMRRKIKIGTGLVSKY